MPFLPGQFPLYFVTDHNLNAGRPKLDIIAAALRGGARLIQFRDKVLSDADFEAEAEAALELCRKHGATLLVNDRVEVAKKIGADGVHLGQEDMNPVEARRILGPYAIIGISTHDEKEVRTAQTLPVTYINIGPMFPTGTKNHLHDLGLDEVLRLALLNVHPWTTMGGIKQHHLQELFGRGVKTVSMVTEISLAEDVEKRTLELLEKIGATKIQAGEKAQEKGQGVFAAHSLANGENIGCFEGTAVEHPTQYSLTLGDLNIEPTGPLRFLNHSCSPNAFFTSRWLTAARNISTGEEITIDYLATEKIISNGFLCRCGFKNCKGWIGQR